MTMVSKPVVDPVGGDKRKGWITRFARRVLWFMKPKRVRTTPKEYGGTGTSASIRVQRKYLDEDASNSQTSCSSDKASYTTTLSGMSFGSLGARSTFNINGNADGELAEFADAWVANETNFKKWYKLLVPRGNGTFSKVYKAYHRFTSELVAVKKVDKEFVKDELDRTFLEIDALQRLDHPNICKMYQVFETKVAILIILEYCQYDLFDVIHAEKKIKEKRARKIFRQVVNVVEYIHSKGFVHRDIKPENVLFDENGNVKMIDFNLSGRIFYGPNGWNKLSTHCGTIEYAAPELLKDVGTSSIRTYEGPPVDSWSLGVLLYLMLTGKFPFEEPDQRMKIMNCDYKLPAHLSRESCLLIRSLMQQSPQLRLTPAQILVHPWLQFGLKKELKKNPDMVTRYYPNHSIFDGKPDKEITEFMASQMEVPASNILKTMSSRPPLSSYEFGIYSILSRKKEVLGSYFFDAWKILWKKELDNRREGIYPESYQTKAFMGKKYKITTKAKQ